MAKFELHSAFAALSGSMGGIVYKRYKDKRGLVLSRKPDMSNVTPSPAQLAHREAMRRAGEFHRQVLRDPGLLKKYQQIARREKINLSAATMREVLRKKKN